jgi:hypothetical protein
VIHKIDAASFHPVGLAELCELGALFRPISGQFCASHQQLIYITHISVCLYRLQIYKIASLQTNILR